ncbi:Expansin-like B1 [Hibiscus syriacus]|uniref:Expansin-like B1 n=1 Tax=Hibiscus syriacus TaxID=106335 RepID=A0A6A2Y927_HIBSY|nr:expansin-like B1 [Hibiscus syriacus]KAE8678635.1 Expansin-like B1 [Hibiscus syriacus]
MGFSLKFQFCLVSVMVLLPALCISQEYFVKSRATYYGSPDCLATPSGACGFGEYGRTVNDANVAGVSKLFKNGTGCGNCYQVRCTNPQICTDNGVKIVVTDYGEGDYTDFILSTRAYVMMAQSDFAAHLFAYGVVDVEYQRISCQYFGYKLQVKIKEHSKYPNYLAIVMLYQAGKNEILSVDIWQEDCKEWIGMRRAYGAVFDTANPPYGAITLRFQVRGSAGLTWVQAPNVIPSDWKSGVAYETDIQLY